METIRINGIAADITLEAEKTLGEFLTGLDSWLENQGQYLSGLEVDGETYGSAAMEKAFGLPLDGIKHLEIKTASQTDLTLEALLGIKNDLEYYEKNPLESKAAFSEWELSYTAAFLKKNSPDVYTLVQETLEGKLSPSLALSPITERIREIKNPGQEIKTSVPLIIEISKRLEDLPLDVQTGKDQRAAETLALFSAMTEKLFRLLFLIKRYGVDVENIAGFISEFGSAVQELLSAYENKDTVLVGDLAEYELAPRLLELSSRLGEFADTLEVA
jgi:hypothetical protein